MKVSHAVKNTQWEWERHAKESVTVEYIKGTFYGYCSELAALRLFYHYRHTYKAKGPVVDVGYSPGMGTNFFRLETSLELEEDDNGTE